MCYQKCKLGLQQERMTSLGGRILWSNRINQGEREHTHDNLTGTIPTPMEIPPPAL